MSELPLEKLTPQERKKIAKRLHFYWPDADFVMERSKNNNALVEIREEIEAIAKNSLRYAKTPKHLEIRLVVAIAKLAKAYQDYGLPEKVASQRAALSVAVIHRAITCAAKEIEDEKKARKEKQVRREALADAPGEREEDPRDYVGREEERKANRARYNTAFSLN